MSNLLANPGFETPTVADWTPGVTGATWTFTNGTGAAGITHAGATFIGAKTPPDGTQVAAIQGAGAMSQTVTAPSTANYLLTLFACQIGGTSNQSFSIKVDGVTVGTCLPPSQSGFVQFSYSLSLTAGSRVITLTGLGDNSQVALLDKFVLDAGGSGFVAAPGSTFVPGYNGTDETPFIYSPNASYNLGSTRVFNNAGNGFRTKFTGQSCTAALDLTSLYQPSNCRVYYRIDSPQWTPAIVDTSIDLTNGVPLYNGLHTLHFYISVLSGGDRYSGSAPQQSALVFRGLMIDGGASTYTPRRRAKTSIFYGDSFVTGALSLPGQTPTSEDALVAFAFQIGEKLNTEVGVVASGGIGYLVGGAGVGVGFAQNWPNMYAGLSRLDGGGHFKVPPDLIYIAEGNNDTSTISGDGSLQVAIHDTLIAIRAAAPNAIILHQSCPYKTGNPASADPDIVAAIASVADPLTPPMVPLSVIGFSNVPPGSSVSAHPTAPMYDDYATSVVDYINSKGYLGPVATAYTLDFGSDSPAAGQSYKITASLPPGFVLRAPVTVTLGGTNVRYSSTQAGSLASSGTITIGVGTGKGYCWFTPTATGTVTPTASNGSSLTDPTIAPLTAVSAGSTINIYSYLEA